MKKYSEKQKLYEVFDDTQVDLDLIVEGVVKDFIYNIKTKYFNDVTFVKSDVLNELSYKYMISLVKSLDFLKFKKFKISNLFYDPKKIINIMQNDLLSILENEYKDNSSIGSDFTFKRKYKNNTALVDVCQRNIDNLRDWVDDNIDVYINKVYKVGKKAKQDSGLIAKFKDIILFPFFGDRDSTNDEKAKKTKLDKLADLVLERVEEFMNFRYDSIYIMNDESALTNIPTDAKRPVEKGEDVKDADVTKGKDEEYPEEKYDISNLNTSEFLSYLKFFQKKNRDIQVLADDFYTKWKPIIERAYKEIVAEKKKKPSNTEMAKKIKDIYNEDNNV